MFSVVSDYFSVFHESLHISGFWIEIVRDKHSLVASWRFVSEKLYQFRLVKLLVLFKEVCYLCHYCI